MCGGNLEVTEGMRICQCSYCRTFQTVPDVSSEKKLRIFETANRLRFNCEFDRAADVYTAIINDFPDEPEAYWGTCLCRYGIEYINDPDSGRKIPTCHRAAFESILDDRNFRLALEKSDTAMRRIYMAEARIIDDIQKHILAIAAEEQPFDIFICYKESDKNGQRTSDSITAENVYKELTKEGYKVFFARETLKNKLGTEFEPYIFSAISSAEIMLCIGTSEENFNAVWVKNEWGRFLDMMKSDKNKLLIPCCVNCGVESLPEQLQGFQAQLIDSTNNLETLKTCIREFTAGLKEAGLKYNELFKQYENQLKSERLRLKALENERHRQAVYEKNNARKLYRHESLPGCGLIVLDSIAAGFIGFIWLGIRLSNNNYTSLGSVMMVTLAAALIPVFLVGPYVKKRNKKAKQNLHRRLAYDENAPSYEYGSSKEAMERYEYQNAQALYRREHISNTAWLLLSVFIAGASVFPALMTDYLLYEAGIRANIGPVIWILWAGIPLAIVGILIKRKNKRAEENLKRRLSYKQK